MGNNSARAAPFFVQFFAAPAKLRREMTNFKLGTLRSDNGDVHENVVEK